MPLKSKYYNECMVAQIVIFFKWFRVEISTLEKMYFLMYDFRKNFAKVEN